MFLLGHSCWSYLFSKITGRQLKVTIPAHLALLAGILPDFDIYFRPLIEHHTYTHSLLVIIPTVIVLTYFFGKVGFAFSAGILSHLLADSIVGSIPLLYPFYPDLDVGLNLGIPSLADTALELGALILLIVYAWRNGDYKLVLKPQRESLLLAIPLVALVTLTLLFAGDRNIPLATFAFSRRALTLITLGHIVLAGILSLGTVQGARWHFRNRKPPNPPATPHPGPSLSP
ncbi:MAG TPA: metal-dependent hydrolase [Candidatus Bathyarchaeia archaeon]|nr:metal-dependent hydrolase [Candidatus Bathyarchaeia archaeon]